MIIEGIKRLCRGEDNGKKNKKRIVKGLILIILMLILYNFLVNKITVYASVIESSSSYDIQAQDLIDMTILEIEMDLSLKRTDVLSQLYNKKVFYNNLLLNATGDEYIKIQNLVTQSQFEIDVFQEYKDR